jgi:hypothetical protein
MSATAVRAGVDTWKAAWKVDPDGPEGRYMSDRATVPSRLNSWLVPEPIHGHRVQWFPEHGLLAAEGHPAGKGELCAASDLQTAYDGLERALCDADLPLPLDGNDWRKMLGNGLDADPGNRPMAHLGRESQGRLGLSRLDVTVDVEMAPVDGLTTLAGLIAVAHTTPGMQCRPIGSVDGRRWETVALHSRGGGMLGRIYDKGVESGSAEAGRLIRPEAQRRYDGRARMLVSDMDTGYIRRVFERRFAPLRKASKGVTVAGPVVLFGKLNDLVDSEELSVAQAERLAGFIALTAVRSGRDRSRMHSRATDYRRQLELRELGLVPNGGALVDDEISLDPFWDAALDAPGLAGA